MSVREVRVGQSVDVVLGLSVPNCLRTGLTFLIPVAFAVTVPVEALTGRLTAETLLNAAALTAAARLCDPGRQLRLRVLC